MDKTELFNKANAMAGRPMKFRNAAGAVNKIDLLGELKKAGLKDLD